VATQQALLFGTIALQSGRLSREHLDSVLREQENASTPVGEICRRRGLLSSNQVRRILQQQRDGALAEAETRLGLLAVQNGLLREEELGAALEQQKDASRKLGEILVERGALSSQALKALLAAQSRLRDGTPPEAEEDLDTQEIPVPPSPSSTPADPRAWLIHESTGERSELFPVGRSATLGRMPSHEVPVPDMGASRHHAKLEFSPDTRRHILTDLDSRNGTFVNGERIGSARPLSPGDLLRIGDTIFRYAVGPGIDILSAPQNPPQAGGAPVLRPGRPRIIRILESAKGALGRLAPGLHPQRQFFIVASWLGLLATFLPWTRRVDGPTELGTHGLGWVTFLLFSGILGMSFTRERARPPAGRSLLVILVASTVAAVIGMVRLIMIALDPAMGGGIGLHLSSLAGVGILLTLWISFRPEDPTPLPDARQLWGSVKGAAALAGGTTVRLIRGMAGGRKAHEKAVTFRKRDDLLRLIGESARKLSVPCVETDLVLRAEYELGESQRRVDRMNGDTPPKDAILLRHDLKNAELRLERTLQKLGRSVIDRGVPLDDQRTRIAEVMLLDQRMKELG
jgi:hypothetical protein